MSDTEIMRSSALSAGVKLGDAVTCPECGQHVRLRKLADDDTPWLPPHYLKSVDLQRCPASFRDHTI